MAAGWLQRVDSLPPPPAPPHDLQLLASFAVGIMDMGSWAWAIITAETPSLLCYSSVLSTPTLYFAVHLWQHIHLLFLVTMTQMMRLYRRLSRKILWLLWSINHKVVDVDVNLIGSGDVCVEASCALLYARCPFLVPLSLKFKQFESR